MHAVIAGTAILAVISGAMADFCTKGQVEIMGNWYCQSVRKVTYQNLYAQEGSYNKITGMDSDSGTCTSEPYQFSGKMSPLDEDMSFNIRGPIRFTKFAVYYPGSSTSKVSARSPRADAIKHGHQHFHEMLAQKRAGEKRRPQAPTPAPVVDSAGQPEWIVATINGDVVSWTNSLYSGTPSPPTPTPSVPEGQPQTGGSGHKDHDHSNRPDKPNTPASSGPIIPGDWVRAAYYDAKSGTADGVTFLNNKGGSGSGVFDYSFGNSASYAASNGIDAAPSSQVLSDTLLPSAEELIVMSDRECKDGDCGFVRPGTVAYHGFPGKHKAFFMEFEMPDDGSTGFNGNMPAIWMLNGQIVRTLQYGNPDCSCWVSGCGEVDMFEVLNSGNHRMKSTLHGFFTGGDADWFQRPTHGPVKAAVVFNGEEIHMQLLDSSVDFGSSMAQSTMDTICGIVDELSTSIYALAT